MAQNVGDLLIGVDPFAVLQNVVLPMETAGRTARVVLPAALGVHVLVPVAALESHQGHEVLMLFAAAAWL